VLSTLAALGSRESQGEPAQRALQYLRRRQREDGSFDSLWFRAFTRGTTAVIEALADLGLGDEPIVYRAAKWLRTHQNADGGWGDGQGASSTAEETAWAVAALLRLGSVRYSEEIERGIGWLVDRQRADGGWDAAAVGLYFSSIVYSNTFYSLSYPLIALSRYGRRELNS
jgi:squalene-hopene/tetraprenyl-beta-curcumene cyclase